MTNAERYLSTLSPVARLLATWADSAGRRSAQQARMAQPGAPHDARYYAAANHALGLPPHVLSTLAEAIRADKRA